MRARFCKFSRTMLFIALGLFPVSCGGSADNGSPEERYQAAIADASDARPSEIATDLIPIVPENPNLMWKSEGGKLWVLMSTWTSWTGYIGEEGQAMTVRETWVTAAPRVEEFCSRRELSSSDLTLRLEELIGVPPDSKKTLFVDMWVNPDDLFRPAADPDITTTTTGLEFPEKVSPEYVEWFNNLKAASYGPDGYPWTRLGYTCDWRHGYCAEGPSEFVVRSGSTVKIEAVVDTFTYCGLSSN